MNCPNLLYQYPLDELLKNSAFNIFDFSDDFVELAQSKKVKKVFLANINKYAQAADTVLTVNEHLKGKYAHLNKNIHIVKNGTNYRNFERNNYRIIPFLENLKNNQMPIIGYTGISNVSRIDLEILKYLLQNKPKWQYVFIGSKGQELMERFSHYKNFFSLPSVTYEVLPDHINYFDVAIVPFKINAHTKGNNLLKFHDYLAMGKPIVTTKIGGAEDFKGVVRIAHTPEAFLKEIEKALIDTSQDLIQRRKKVAFENSWPNRIKEVEELIRRHLDIDDTNP